MAQAILKPCSFSGCKSLAHGRFCTAHAAEVSKRFDRQRSADPVRKLYFTKRWGYIRQSVLALQPICAACGERPSEEVDHVVPAHEWIAKHGDDLNQFFNEENLSGKCKPCHSSKTARENSFGGNR